MKITTARESFQSLFNSVHDGKPPPGGHVQTAESERMFMAGVRWALEIALAKLTLLSDEQAEFELGKLIQETKDYFATLAQAGRDISRS